MRLAVLRLTFLFICCIAAVPGIGQDLDPRAYTRLPIQTTVLSGGYSYSAGGVVTDPTLPLDDLKARVHSVAAGVVHSFPLFGLTAQAMAVLPVSWADANAVINGQREYVSRWGLADMRLRMSVLFLGGPAASVPQLLKSKRGTVLGASLNVVAPTGQFFSNKLINIGTNRWAFRPELGLSQPLSKRWLIDVYAGVWFFTNNREFFPGNALRTQNPLAAFQTHVSYNIGPRAWAAFDATYYVGGQSTINEDINDDRQSNTRLGFTVVMPVGKRNLLKLSASNGAVVRVGQDFTTVSVGWMSTWIGKKGRGM
jgi:hypothetical protein